MTISRQIYLLTQTPKHIEARVNGIHIQRKSLELKSDESNGGECDAMQLSDTLNNLVSDICEAES